MEEIMHERKNQMLEKIERSYKKKKIEDSSFSRKEKRKEKLHEVKKPKGLLLRGKIVFEKVLLDNGSMGK